MYHHIKPASSDKVAAALISCFAKTLYELKRKPKLSAAERRHLRDIREAARKIQKGF